MSGPSSEIVSSLNEENELEQVGSEASGISAGLTKIAAVEVSDEDGNTDSTQECDTEPVESKQVEAENPDEDSEDLKTAHIGDIDATQGPEVNSIQDSATEMKSVQHGIETAVSNKIPLESKKKSHKVNFSKSFETSSVHSHPFDEDEEDEFNTAIAFIQKGLSALAEDLNCSTFFTGKREKYNDEGSDDGIEEGESLISHFGEESIFSGETRTIDDGPAVEKEIENVMKWADEKLFGCR